MLDVALAAEPALSTDPFVSRLLALLGGSAAPATHTTPAGDGDGDGDGQASASAPTLNDQPAPEDSGNYVIPDDLMLGAGGPKAKASGTWPRSAWSSS